VLNTCDLSAYAEYSHSVCVYIYHVHALSYTYIKFTCSHKLNIYNIYSKSYTKSH
jgi:hypothetical protein